MTMLFTSVPTKTLAQTINSSSTKLIVNNIIGWNGSALTSAEFGTRLFAVLRNSDNSIIEIFELDPSTTADGATTGFDILKAGMNFTGDISTEVAANKQTWVKNQTFVELGSHVPQLLNHMVQIIGNQTIAGVKTFASLPATTGGDAISDNDLVRKAQLDAAVLGQIGTNKVVVAGLAGETITAGQLVYFDTVTNNKWMKCDANTAASVDNVEMGIAQGAGTDGLAITGGILTKGLDSNQTGMTAGDVMYASDTAGDIASSAGTVEVTVGAAYSATDLYFNPRFNQQITENQQDALVGSSGTPGPANTYITEEDTSDAAASGKIVRAIGTALPALDGSNLTGIVTFATITAGEALTALDAVVIGDNSTEQMVSLGGTASSESVNSTVRVAQLVTTASDTLTISAVDVKLSTGGGSGTTEVTVGIYADSAGVPTGSVLGTVTRSLGITASTVDYTFTFTTPISVSASTNYHIVVYRSGTSQTTYLQRNDTGSLGTTKSTNSGSSFSAINGALYIIVYDVNHVPGSIYRADASTNNVRANTFIGFVEASVISGDPAVVTSGAVINFLTGLTAGSLYYLSDTTGQISTTNGSQSRLIGRALTATKLLIQPIFN